MSLQWLNLIAGTLVILWGVAIGIGARWPVRRRKTNTCGICGREVELWFAQDCLSGSSFRFLLRRWGVCGTDAEILGMEKSVSICVSSLCRYVG